MSKNKGYPHNYFSVSLFNKSVRIIFLFILLYILSINNFCLAQETKSITLENLDPALSNGLMLKNVKSFRDVYFTKPQTWQILPGSVLNLTFNHSTELIPSRSILSVFINSKLVKKEPLDSSSFNTKTISIPIPLVGLGNYNTIRFQVEQHYTNKCEDPLEHSLWTSIKPQTQIVFHYREITPRFDLARYPFPIFDPFQYFATEVNYVTPSLNKQSDKSLNALGLIAADIAQKINWHKMKFNAIKPDNTTSNEHSVIIGTPEENSSIVKLNKFLGNSIKNINGRPVIIDKSGQELNKDWGVIYFINNPSNINKALLVITGNSPSAVNKAAKYLSNDSLTKNLKGTVAVIKDYSPHQEASNNIAKYVYNKSMSFYKLGFNDKKAERMGAPPLNYPIRIIPDLSTSKEKLSLNIIYSYSPKLNPELSSMEVIFNGHSLQGVKLDNVNGEKNKSLKINIPHQYVNTYNDLQVVFHLFPDKFGYCVDYYDDNTWATVSKDSSVNLPSDAKILAPNLELFNDEFYPYTIKQDLSNTSIIMPDNPTVNDYQALLNVISAIGSLTNSEAGLNLITAKAMSSADADLYNRDIITIGSIDKNQFTYQISKFLFITFDNLINIFTPAEQKKALLAYNQNQGLIEQIKSKQNNDKLTTIIYGKTDNAVKLASELFVNKKFISSLVDGNFYVVSPDKLREVLLDEKLSNDKKIQKQNAIKATMPKSQNEGPFNFIINIIVGIVVFFVIIFILRILLNIISGRKET